jgi:hypothetical protein
MVKPPGRRGRKRMVDTEELAEQVLALMTPPRLPQSLRPERPVSVLGALRMILGRDPLEAKRKRVVAHLQRQQELNKSDEAEFRAEAQAVDNPIARELLLAWIEWKRPRSARPAKPKPLSPEAYRIVNNLLQILRLLGASIDHR